jgi:hypothetical protein
MPPRNEAEWFAAGVIFRLNPETREEEVLVLDYVDMLKGTRRVKLPGGNQKVGDADPLSTLGRELAHELGTPIYLGAVEIWSRPVSPAHTQYFFLAECDHSALRAEWIQDDEGDEQLGPPRFVRLEWALEEWGETARNGWRKGNIFCSHRVALREVVEILQGRLALP